MKMRIRLCVQEIIHQYSSQPMRIYYAHISLFCLDVMLFLTSPSHSNQSSFHGISMLRSFTDNVVPRSKARNGVDFPRENDSWNRDKCGDTN